MGRLLEVRAYRAGARLAVMAIYRLLRLSRQPLRQSRSIIRLDQGGQTSAPARHAHRGRGLQHVSGADPPTRGS